MDQFTEQKHTKAHPQSESVDVRRRRQQQRIIIGNKLKEDDLVDILEDFWDARESALSIGFQLKIPLETIVQSTTDKGEILIQILEEYLKGNGCQPITRERLIKALETKMVGLPRLANHLRQKYSPASSGEYIVNHNNTAFLHVKIYIGLIFPDICV